VFAVIPVVEVTESFGREQHVGTRRRWKSSVQCYKIDLTSN
jgi:hypothetical protein